jgi:GxxExxY protein
MNRNDIAPHESESLLAGRTLDQIGKDIIDAAFTVHKTMGPGLNEAIYHECLCRELQHRGIPYVSEEVITIEYRGVKLDKRYVADLVVEGRVIVEIKSVSDLLPIHEAQLLNYLKLTNTQLGYLINFNVELIKNGIKRRVNNFKE